ncbi:MAG TPA: hypothetical protein HPP54_06740 [Nitrospinae bacterium]|nr:hypothetical protein [Nitrospinota bacterium]
MKINYDVDFISTEDATGPNIKITGSNEKICGIKIKKVIISDQCGFKQIPATVGANLYIETINKTGKTDCEMMIDLVVHKNTKILGWVEQ